MLPRGLGASSGSYCRKLNIGKVPTERTHLIIPAATPNACALKDANGIAASIQVTLCYRLW